MLELKVFHGTLRVVVFTVGMATLTILTSTFLSPPTPAFANVSVLRLLPLH